MPASMKHSSSVLFIPHSVPITKLWLFVESLSSLVHSWCLFLGLLTTALFPPVVQWQPDFWAAPGNSPWFPLAWLRLVSRGSRGESCLVPVFQVRLEEDRHSLCVPSSRWGLRGFEFGLWNVTSEVTTEIFFFQAWSGQSAFPPLCTYNQLNHFLLISREKPNILTTKYFFLLWTKVLHRYHINHSNVEKW